MATTVKWSTLANGGNYTLDLYHPTLNPAGDILRFDLPFSITPYNVEFYANDDLTEVTVVDLRTFKTVTLNIDPLTVTSSNVTFAGGGLVLVGDGSYGTVNDHLGNTLVGGNGNDQLFGLAGDDSLAGGAGQDVFTDGYGDNTLVGGAGDDFFYVFSDIGSSNTVTGGTGRDFYYLDYESPALLGPPGSPGHDYVVTDFEAGPGRDIVYTSDLVYIAIGYTDQDPIAAGFLRLVQLDADTFVYQGDRDGAAGSVHTWMNLITLNIAFGTLTFADNFPDLVIGTDSSELLTGTERNDLMPALLGDDTLSGLGGKDYLAAAEGNDILNGGTGADTMLGGSGSDLYYVDDAGDAVVEESNSPGALLLPGAGTGEAGPGQLDTQGITDTIKAALNYSISNLEFIENLTLTGAAARAKGNALANLLTGNAGTDTLIGGAGNDTIDGKEGSDILDGGTGNDTLIWGTGDTFNGGAGTDTLRISSGNVDLTTAGNPNNKLLNIEQIDLGSGNHILKLNKSDVIDMSPTDQIKVLGDNGDTVNIVGTQSAGTDLGNGFMRYTIGAAALVIDSDITVM